MFSQVLSLCVARKGQQWQYVPLEIFLCPTATAEQSMVLLPTALKPVFATLVEPDQVRKQAVAQKRQSLFGTVDKAYLQLKLQAIMQEWGKGFPDF